ncbi:DUF4253 domain-containing protein [Neobacillus sp. YIM B06451]|uniref:DUF4253 domain-containing protein n=1 Tax=Neobacillus sp. YIM B06451 TaxID=3070994 RepID=UPI00292F996B|nr:DUF4253 domain-containing protein [Neobacillus sp. YIM B06451]
MAIFNKFRKKDDYIEEIKAKVGCDCLLIEEKDANSIMAKYLEALKEGEKQGYTPLIIIPSAMMVDIFETEGDKGYSPGSRDSIIEKAKDIDAKDLLKRMLDEVMPLEEDYDITGEFSIEDQIGHFLSIEKGINKKIIIAKIPTSKPWEVAAWVPMGGFNECPMPEEQVAIFQHWFEKYGAIPALVDVDVWELVVKNPPKTQEESVELAWEQFGFCSDIVWQGVGTVNALAGTLINSSTWYFWWD